MPSPQNVNPNQIVFLMQIISVSLIMGILLFLGVAMVMAQDQQPSEPYLTYVALVFAGAAILGHHFVRIPVQTDRLNQLAEEGQFVSQSDGVFAELAPKYQTEHIIKMALLEGPAFFAGVAYMQEKVWWNLAAIGLIIFLMLIRFPTHSRINAWIERKTLALQFGNRDY
jgi:hypothetical protein